MSSDALLLDPELLAALPESASRRLLDHALLQNLTELAPEILVLFGLVCRQPTQHVEDAPGQDAAVGHDHESFRLVFQETLRERAIPDAARIAREPGCWTGHRWQRELPSFVRRNSASQWRGAGYPPASAS